MGCLQRLHLICDGKGRPLSVLLTPGQRQVSTRLGALLDAIRVPSWAINFVRSTGPLSDGRYSMQTPAGELIYRFEENPRCRTVDFAYETPEGQKTMILPTRIVAHGSGSVFRSTVHRQPGMSDADWKQGRRGLDEELEELKRRLEA